MNAVVRHKAFNSGDGIAVLLPVSLCVVAGTELELVTNGGEVVVRPVPDAVTEKAKLDRMIERLRALGPVGEVEVREPIEFPERSGL